MRRRHRLGAPRLVARAAWLAAVGVVLGASPAAADPPAPGDHRSRVTAVEPDVPGVSVEVVGGDSFLSLAVERGVEVVVLGYEGEEYLRVLADGTVERNTRSPASYLNDDRYAAVDLPPELVGADPTELEPEWERVAGGGAYAWHDHRIHWMAPGAPPHVARGDTFDWSGPVELVVDGQPVSVLGETEYVEDVSPLPWLAGGAVLAAMGVVALRRRTLPLAVLGTAVAIGAAWVAWSTYDLAPDGAGASPLPVVAAGTAIAAGVAAVALPERVRPLALAALASVLGAWGLLRFGVLTNPVLPTTAPDALDRGVTVAAIAVAVAGAVAALAGMALAPDDRTDPT
jgi:hypothetical protein